MAREQKGRRIRRIGVSYDLVVIGGERMAWRDAYHALLRLRLPTAMAVIVGVYLLMNVVFAVGFYVFGGVANIPRGSFRHAFFFSIETMATIGYGNMYPESVVAHVLVTVESIIGLFVTALVTGFAFVRFSLIRGRVMFSRNPVIASLDGVPTLMVRLGNERSNIIYDARIEMMLVRSRSTAEGMRFYQNTHLKLAGAKAPNLGQSWTIRHLIDSTSPLFGATPASLEELEAELQISMVGTDDTSGQKVHGRQLYEIKNVRWGARFADVLSEMPDGNLQMDLSKFHELVWMPPTENFPYPLPKS